MKLGFCFLTYGDLDRPDLWNLFFKNIDHSLYRILIHPKNHSSVHQNLYHFPINIVKKIIPTHSKTDYRIVEATLQVLKEMYESDHEITHFLFLSQSCMPIYNFQQIYGILQTVHKSILSKKDGNCKFRYQNLDYKLKPYLSYEKFTKQQPNMMLVRNDVEILIRYSFVSYFKHMICPDEHYFINILIHLFHSKIITQQIVFCNWDFHKTQGIVFPKVTLSMIEEIRKQGFLFMRKINLSSEINDTSFL